MRYGRHGHGRTYRRERVYRCWARYGGLSGGHDGVSAIPVLKTSHRAWLEKGEEQPRFDDGVDERDTYDVLLMSIAPHPMIDKGKISRVAVWRFKLHHR